MCLEVWTLVLLNLLGKTHICLLKEGKDTVLPNVQKKYKNKGHQKNLLEERRPDAIITRGLPTITLE